MLRYPDSPGFLIDGFPREASQGVQFEEEVKKKTSSSYALRLINNVVTRMTQRLFFRRNGEKITFLSFQSSPRWIKF